MKARRSNDIAKPSRRKPKMGLGIVPGHGWNGWMEKLKSAQGESSSENDEGPPAMWGYMRAKAKRYLEVGPDVYRDGDALRMPPEDWTAELLALVNSGLLQLLDDHGFRKDDPFVGIGIDGFYAMMRLLHFERSGQYGQFDGTTMILDRMLMTHVMHGTQIVLYNLVPAPPGRRRLPPARSE